MQRCVRLTAAATPILHRTALRNMAGFTIRKAEPVEKDISDIAQVCASGFIDDPLFGFRMHPKRREYPDDWLRFWSEDLQEHLSKSDAYGYVIEDTAVRRPVGVTLLQRLCKTTPDDSGNHDNSKKWNNRAADPEWHARFEQNYEDVKPMLPADCWYMGLLCIHKDYWYRGLAKPLVDVAIDLARQETPRVPLCLVSSALADRHYEKWGFYEIGFANIGGMSILPREEGGGSIKLYDKHLKEGV